jgi:hypothetical protein
MTWLLWAIFGSLVGVALKALIDVVRAWRSPRDPS